MAAPWLLIFSVTVFSLCEKLPSFANTSIKTSTGMLWRRSFRLSVAGTSESHSPDASRTAHRPPAPHHALSHRPDHSASQPPPPPFPPPPPPPPPTPPFPPPPT